MSEHSSVEYPHHDEDDMYEEVQQHMEEAVQDEDEMEASHRSATRRPEDDNDDDGAAPPVAPLEMQRLPPNGRHDAAGEGSADRSRRRSNAAAATPRASSRQGSPRVRRSGSVFSNIRTGDGRHITKENHESLMPDPAVQQLRRQSIIAASRYRSARRANSVTNAMGVADGSHTPRRTGSVASSPARHNTHLSEAEAEVMALIAANDERRLEAYERAREMEMERECFVIDQEIGKHVKAEETYVKQLEERAAEMRRRAMAREKRNEEAARRRQEQEDARRRVIEEKLQRKEEQVPTADPYHTFLAKRKYSAPTGMMRGSDAGAIAPQRRRHADTNGGHTPRRGGGGAGGGSASRRRSSSVASSSGIVEHSRGWR